MDGIGAIIMDDAIVESNSIIATRAIVGAIVSRKTIVPSRTVCGGVPAKKLKRLIKI